MIPIQIITINCAKKVFRIMIEQENNQYRIHIATKTTDYFSGFNLIENNLFLDAESAFLFALKQYIDLPIVSVKNETSDLLTSTQIMNLTGLTQISES